MAIQDDFSVAANGDIRYTGTTANYTVIALHRWLQDLADDAAGGGNDLLDITDTTPSERSTDNIITLLAPYNIDDTAAQHLYDGSITQEGGDTVYSGLVVVGAVEAGTQLMLVQDHALLTSYWGTGLNADAAANILLRIMVKTRTAGADIDGKRIRVQARELGDTYAEFGATLGLGNATAAIFTAADLNNETLEATISGWTDIGNTEGYQLLDVDGDLSGEPYYSQWDKAAHSINDLYERAKWLVRRGSVSTLYGMDGELFRGITHEVAVSAGTGTWVQNEEVSWGSGATAGTGALLAADSLTGSSTTKLWIQLLTGVAPASGTITGNGGATGTIGTVTARTVSPAFLGQSTGSAIIGAFGVGIQPADLSASDLLFDLTNTPQNPPNNVTFSVGGLEFPALDYVLVGPATGSLLDTGQLSLNGALSGGEGTVTVNETIPSDTPTAGTIRIFSSTVGTFVRVPYTGFSGSQFTGCTNVPAALNGADVFISYIDTIADAVQESFTVVYASPRSLFIRVRCGVVSPPDGPIKTFETTGTLGAAGGSTTAIRTMDT